MGEIIYYPQKGGIKEVPSKDKKTTDNEPKGGK